MHQEHSLVAHWDVRLNTMKYIILLIIFITPSLVNADGYSWSYKNSNYSLTYNINDQISEKPKCNYNEKQDLPLPFNKAITISHKYLVEKIDPKGIWLFDNIIIKMVADSTNNECIYLLEFINKNMKRKKGTLNNSMFVGLYTDGEIIKTKTY